MFSSGHYPGRLLAENIRCWFVEQTRLTYLFGAEVRSDTTTLPHGISLAMSAFSD
jgi:hypothetical protein